MQGLTKKLTIGLFVIGFSSISLANGAYVAPMPVPAPKQVNYFDGFYLGFGGGISHTISKTDFTATDEIIYEIADSPSQTQEIIFPSKANSDLGENMGAGQAFVGWGKSLGENKNVYLGLELFGRYTPTSMSASQSSSFEERADFYSNEKLTNDYSFGGDIRLGYLITPKIMVYALAGADIGDFTYHIDHSITQYTSSTTTVTNSVNSEVDTWQYGFMPGAGIEAMLNDHVSLRAQYTYTFFGDGDNTTNSSETQSTDFRTTLSSSVSGTANSVQRGLFTVDLTYRFNGI
jgi:opacity protein-like surface antigen